MTTFDPAPHLIKLQGKDYLPVYARIMWFRMANPDGVISTDLIQLDPAVVRATITTAAGQIVATGYGTAVDNRSAKWAGRAVEKAETAAIGRALAHAGYGTQFVEDDGDADYPADSPLDKTTRPAPAPVIASPPSPPTKNGQIEMVGAYGLTDAQLDATATADALWSVIYGHLDTFGFNARPDAMRAVAPMMPKLCNMSMRAALESVRNRKQHPESAS
ncbi:MAG: hypothetical protein HXY38_15040 [Chloroflexi bacterium]|nr:hypothetical protein [Chloroflexota bacterium]